MFKPQYKYIQFVPHRNMQYGSAVAPPLIDKASIEQKRASLQRSKGKIFTIPSTIPTETPAGVAPPRPKTPLPSIQETPVVAPQRPSRPAPQLPVKDEEKEAYGHMLKMQDEQMRMKVDAKNDLENMCYSVKKQFESNEQIVSKVKEIIVWLDSHQNEEAELYEEKKKELTDFVQQNANIPEGNDSEFDGTGPEIKEVD